MTGFAPLPWHTEDRVGDGLVVREATAQDASHYVDHLGALVEETHFMLQSPDDPLPDVQDQRALLEQFHRIPNCLCVVALRPGRGLRRPDLAGSLTLLGGQTSRTRHVAQLGMGVRKQDWGRGVGGALMDAAVTWARANPVLRRVSLLVYDSNVTARRLYERKSFVSEGRLVREVKLGKGRYEDLLPMALDVQGDLP